MNQQGTSYLLSDWQPLYVGIDYASGAAVNALDLVVVPPAIRIQHVNILRIELSAPGISFFTTPPADPKKHGQMVGQTISGFIKQFIQLRFAINANLSWMDNPAVGATFSSD